MFSSGLMILVLPICHLEVTEKLSKGHLLKINQNAWVNGNSRFSQWLCPLKKRNIVLLMRVHLVYIKYIHTVSWPDFIVLGIHYEVKRNLRNMYYNANPLPIYLGRSQYSISTMDYGTSLLHIEQEHYFKYPQCQLMMLLWS